MLLFSFAIGSLTDYIGYFLEFCCFIFCFLHFLFSSRKLKKLSCKVDEYCSLCNKVHTSSDVVSARELVCSLSDDEILLLSHFINYLQGGKFDVKS